MTATITLTTAGVDTGNFSLYSNVDGYTTPFASGLSRAVLIAGYTSTSVPASTTTIRVQSNTSCTNYIDLIVTDISVTTTTLAPTTTTLAPTTTTTTLALTTTTTIAYVPPTVSTYAVTNIGATTATGNGAATYGSVSPFGFRGIAYGTSPNPTIGADYDLDGTGSGAITTSITGLTSNTLYYVRAFAYDGITYYGNQVTFTSLTIPTTTGAPTTTTLAPTTTTTTLTPTTTTTTLTPTTTTTTLTPTTTTTTLTPTTTTTTTTAPDIVAPTVPGNLMFDTGFTNTTTLYFSWAASTDAVGPVSYEVFRDGALYATVSTTSINATGLPTNGRWEWKVRAKDGAPNYSAFTPVRMMGTQPTAPVITKGTDTSTSLQINWTAIANTTSYSVYVQINGGSGGAYWTHGITGTTYTITGLTGGDSVETWAQAWNPDDASDTSNTITHTVIADTTPPSKVLGLVATGNITTIIDLTWNAATDNVGVTGYIWNWSTNGSIWNIGDTTTNLFAEFLAPDTNTLYYFRVQAYDAAGNYGLWSSTAQAYSGDIA